MCDWLVEALGPDVPVHFTAFHPDFRMRDIPPTPPTMLAKAHEIAKRAGLNYVYTGNISDRRGRAPTAPAADICSSDATGIAWATTTWSKIVAVTAERRFQAASTPGRATGARAVNPCESQNSNGRQAA